ncbi:MAG: hypothetical protein GY774_36145 [Planctomycetes bacterium]|nr:hypothetical protein [Planctomycetota bacterium]
MLKFTIFALLLGWGALGCHCNNESNQQTSERKVESPQPPAGILLPPPRVKQKNSFAHIKKSLAKVRRGFSEHDLLETLGSPQNQYEEGHLKVFTYVERPGEFGTMKYVHIEVLNGAVEKVEEGKMSIDPW